MRLLLVNPSALDENGLPVPPGREFTYGLTLPYLAALIPEKHQVKIIDENVERCDPNYSADAVLFTAMTSRVERAYQLAAEFRCRGVKTVLGGMHASLDPDDAQPHVDAVAVGEAESIMPQLIGDLESGRLKERYVGERTDLVGLPSPRYDLMNLPRYLFRTDPIQIVRGCPNHCRYCTVSLVYGSSYRYRPTGDVLRDLERCSPTAFFIDDNIMADRDRALELFRAMRGMGKIWGGQSNFSIAADPELLVAARQSGMISLYTGIETLNQKALGALGKHSDLDPGECIDIIHAHGISIMASMMIGLDGDTVESAYEMLRFLEKHKVHFLCLYILTPNPFIPSYRKIEEQGLQPPPSWRKFDGMHAILLPTNMTREEMENLHWRILERFYSPRSIAKRLLFPPRLTPMLVNLMMRSKLPQRRQPLMGFPEGNWGARLAPLAQRAFQHPLAQRLVQRLTKK